MVDKKSNKTSKKAETICYSMKEVIRSSKVNKIGMPKLAYKKGKIKLYEANLLNLKAVHYVKLKLMNKKKNQRKSIK